MLGRSIFVDGYEFIVTPDADKYASEEELVEEAEWTLQHAPRTTIRHENLFKIGWSTVGGGHTTSEILPFNQSEYPSDCVIILDEWRDSTDCFDVVVYNPEALKRLEISVPWEDCIVIEGEW